ncbi:MAG: hypothetical protein Q4A71_07815, partial [Actinomycetaceae bacterium]|nr:hypothetical protein [Actinomycetaceae bacterium]
MNKTAKTLSFLFLFNIIWCVTITPSALSNIPNRGDVSFSKYGSDGILFTGVRKTSPTFTRGKGSGMHWESTGNLSAKPVSVPRSLAWCGLKDNLNG